MVGASVRGSHGKRTLLKGCAWYPILAPRPHCAEAPLAERKRRETATGSSMHEGEPKERRTRPSAEEGRTVYGVGTEKEKPEARARAPFQLGKS